MHNELGAMLRLKFGIAVLVSVATLLLVSCGDSSESEQSQRTTTSTENTVPTQSNDQSKGGDDEVVGETDGSDNEAEELTGENIDTNEMHGVSIESIRAELSPEMVAQLDELGIEQVVGEFTTYYTPGEDRVINIELIADTLRGAIIEPGEVFSVNDYVGPRTIEKGYVPGEVLISTEGLLPSVGGGISQFVTALFNAGFFAGLNFPEYQAHTYWFERYPYGREATISYGTLDLKIRNITPNGILIWTSYGEGFTTVQLFGTPYFTSVEALEQEINPINDCTQVISPRQRTYLDGETTIDNFYALYQAEVDEPCF